MLPRLFACGLLMGALAAALSKPAFEVATVKPADPSARGYTIRGGPAGSGQRRGDERSRERLG